MSYIDLNKLTMHRHSELGKRTVAFNKQCDEAHRNIENIKAKVNGFKEKLNCDPSELKDRFLNCMQQLDEISYLLTDFNLAFENLESIQERPVTDSEPRALVKSMTPVNLLDVLSDPVPSISYTTPIPKQQFITKAKNKNKDNLLIDLSSASCSEESVKAGGIRPMALTQHNSPKKMNYVSPANRIKTKNKKKNDFYNASQNGANYLSPISVKSAQDQQEISPVAVKSAHNQQEIQLKGQDRKQTTNHFPACFNIQTLPPQKVLECDMIYRNALLISASEFNLYFIPDIQDLYTLLGEMKAYYSLHKFNLNADLLSSLRFCSYHDELSMFYYRAMVLDIVQDGDVSLGEVYLVDTGEVISGPMSAFGLLVPQFTKIPPIARSCHLAGINIIEEQRTTVLDYLNKYIVGTICSVEIEDNNSETLGVYIHLHKDNKSLHQLLIEKGLAKPDPEQTKKVAASNQLEEPTHAPTAKLNKPICGVPAEDSKPTYGPPADDLSEIDILDTPEFDDPLLAVTGYHNRDEAEICPHYRGGPGKTCFKGARCNKRHVLMDPDGWTLDRVQVVGKARIVDLPAPNSWLVGIVTHVAFLDKLYVQIQSKDKEPTDSYGMLPPQTFVELETEMNTPAACAAMQPLTMIPAPGELVAALYPLDERWYRGRVVGHKPNERELEIFFVDYGNTMCVKETNVRELDPAFLVVPLQAILCRIAGVVLKELAPEVMAEAKKNLEESVLEKQFRARVISRGFDDLEVEMYDSEQYNVAEMLVATGVAELKPYKVYDDTQLTERIVVP